MCGRKGLVAHAYQSDDDFYIEYEGAELKKGHVWADGSNHDLSDNLLLFVTSQDVSKGPNVALAVDRENHKSMGFGKGSFNVDGMQYAVNCYVRYGVGEDEYDAISKKPFPRILPPKKD